MKRPTKILALLLALVMALTVFVACDKKDSENIESKTEKTEETAKPEEKKISAEDEVRAVVKDFCNDFNKGKVDDLKAYFAADADVSALESFNPEALFEGVEGMGLSKEQMEGYVKDIFGMVEFTIGDVSISGDEAKAQLTMVAPDFESMELDEEMLMQFMTSQGYTEEELALMFAGGEEGMAEVMPKLFDWLISDILPTAPKTTDEKTLTLVKEGNEWLISKETVKEAA